MKHANSLFLLVVALSFAFLSSCKSDGPGGGSEATSLGTNLTLSGTVIQTFDTSTHALTASYANPDSYPYRLADETADVFYFVDDNADEDVEVNIDYITDDGLHLYNPAGGGLTSSNSAALITTVYIEVFDVGGEIVEGDFSKLPAKAEWYYYLYSSAKTTIDGSYEDDDETHVFDKVTVFAGWNQLIVSTSDGETFTYRGGVLSDPKWTYMD